MRWFPFKNALHIAFGWLPSKESSAERQRLRNERREERARRRRQREKRKASKQTP